MPNKLLCHIMSFTHATKNPVQDTICTLGTFEEDTGISSGEEAGSLER